MTGKWESGIKESTRIGLMVLLSLEIFGKTALTCCESLKIHFALTYNIKYCTMPNKTCLKRNILYINQNLRPFCQQVNLKVVSFLFFFFIVCAGGKSLQTYTKGLHWRRLWEWTVDKKIFFFFHD